MSPARHILVPVLLLQAFLAAAQLPMVDGDADGVSDEIDACPYSAPGVIVGADGCEGPPDTDLDGVPDTSDSCPETPRDALVDPFGCQVPGSGDAGDYDGDGIGDLADACPYSLPGSRVGGDGCALDEDLDGVPDGIDRCPGTSLTQTPDERGCGVGQRPQPVTATRRAQAGSLSDGSPLAPTPPTRPAAGVPAPAPDLAPARQRIRQPEYAVRRLLADIHRTALLHGMASPISGTVISGNALSGLSMQALTDAVAVPAGPEPLADTATALARAAPALAPLPASPPVAPVPAPETQAPPEPGVPARPSPSSSAPQTLPTQLPAPARSRPDVSPSLAGSAAPAAAPVRDASPLPEVSPIPPSPVRLVPVRPEARAESRGVQIDFVGGSAELDGRIMATLRAHAPAWREALRADSRRTLWIRTDRSGDAALSSLRGRIVRAFLMAQGLPAPQLVVSVGAPAGVDVELSLGDD